MKYNTIVEESEAGVNQVLNAITTFNEEGFLEGLSTNQYTPLQVANMLEYVKEHHCVLRRELYALSEYAKTFNSCYALKNNKCFETAKTLLWKVRSSVSATKKIYKQFCPDVRPRRRMISDDKSMTSVFTRSMLLPANHYPDIFGFEGTLGIAQELYKELGEFFITLMTAMNICLCVLRDERLIRENPHKCKQLYDELVEEMLDGARMTVRMMQKYRADAMEPDTLSTQKQNMPEQEFYPRFLHNVSLGDFKQHVVYKEYEQNILNGMTPEEAKVFPDGVDRFKSIRIVMKHFDEIEGVEGKAGKLNGTAVAMFMLWSRPAREKDFVDYFCEHYQGKYKCVKHTAVNNAKNSVGNNMEVKGEWSEKFDKLVAQHSNLQISPNIAS